MISQSFKDFEIILVDDASIDDTLKKAENALQSFKGDRDIIIHKQNRGCFEGRTEAIRKARGEYIAIQDGDDISFLDRFEKQISFLEKNKEIWCLGGWAKKIDEESKDIGEMAYPPKDNEDIIDMIVKKCSNPIIDPTVMFRKNIFNEIKGYSLRKDINLVKDMDLWLRSISLNKKISNLNDYLVKYRINSCGNTRKYQKEMIFQHMVIWREFIKKRSF
jgi:glycosyltransferase involved in cell wall biosynthesis